MTTPGTLDRMRRGRGGLAAVIVVLLLAATLVTVGAPPPPPAAADTPEQVQRCPEGATNDQFNCLRYDWPVQTVEAEQMPDGTFSWVLASDDTSRPTCPNFITTADLPCQSFGTSVVRVFQADSPPGTVLPLVFGTGQVSIGTAGYSDKFTWAGRGCGTYECRYWVRPSAPAFSDGQDRVLIMEHVTQVRTSFAFDGTTTTRRHVLVTVPNPATPPPTPNITYSATGTQGQWRLDGTTSVAHGTLSISSYEWTIPGVGTRTGPVVLADIPRGQLPAQVSLKVTDNSGQSTTTSVVVDDHVFVSGVTFDRSPAVLGAAPVTATMTIQNRGAWPLTDVTGTITSASPTLVGVTAGPTPATLALAPGASGTVTFTLEPTAGGTATLSYSASAIDGTRTLTDGPKQGLLEIDAPALQAQLEADTGSRTAREPFEVRAVVTNTGDTDLTDVRPSSPLAATGIDDTTVSGPTPASIPALAAGASATLTYTVEAPTAGTLDVAFTGRATDPAAGTITSNTARLQKTVAEGLRIDSITAERSGAARGTAKGGELITIRGSGFEDATGVGFTYASETDVQVFVPVSDATDDTITITSPAVADLLEQVPGTDGLAFLADVFVRVADPGAPGGFVDSNAVPYDFEAPFLGSGYDAATGEAFVGAKEGKTVTLLGRGFTDVTTVSLFARGTSDLVATISDPTIVSDTELTFTTPDLVPLLELGDDDVERFAADIRVGYPDDLAVGDVVRSNPLAFDFVGPSIVTVAAEPSGGARTGIRGGGTVRVTGAGLTDASQLVIYQRGTNDVLAIVPVSTEDDSTLTFTAPNMAEFATYGSDEEPGGVNTDIAVAIEDEGAPRPLRISNVLPFDFEGPSITDAVSGRTGGALLSVKGDEIIVTGTGLTDVTELRLYRADAEDELLLTIPVTPESDERITATTPNLASYLQVQDDGIPRVKIGLTAAVVDAAAPRGAVESQGLRLDARGPALTAATGERSGTSADTAKGGVNTIRLEGDLLKDADTLFVFEAGTTETVGAFPISTEDDGTVIVDSPDMTALLRELEDGRTRFEADLWVGYEDAEAPDGVVLSNPVRFDFLAPYIDSFSTASGQDSIGPVKGGDVWTLNGTGFLDATLVVFYRTGTDEVLEAINVQPDSDTELTFTVPDLASHLLPQDDRLDRVKADVRVEYENDDGDDIRSNPIRYDFSPPFIDGFLGGEVDPDGVLRLTVDGGFFSDVDVIGFRDPESDTELVSLAGTVLDDQTIEVEVKGVARYMQRQDDGSYAVTLDLFVGYQSSESPRGAVLSNPAPMTFTAPSLTQVSQFASAGSVEIEVASNDGWQAGDYALVDGPNGSTVRRVRGLGSLIFDAPVPFDLPVGSVISEVGAPDGDTTGPSVSVDGPTTLRVGDVATVSWSCDDGTGVGVEACQGTVPSGSAIDTSAEGTTTVTITAWDRNGNATSRTVTYTVVGDVPPTTAPPTTAPPTTGLPGASATGDGDGPEVAGATETTGSLPYTGSSPWATVWLGTALVAGGAALALVRRRRVTTGAPDRS